MGLEVTVVVAIVLLLVWLSVTGEDGDATFFLGVVRVVVMVFVFVLRTVEEEVATAGCTPSSFLAAVRLRRPIDAVNIVVVADEVNTFLATVRTGGEGWPRMAGGDRGGEEEEAGRGHGCWKERQACKPTSRETAQKALVVATLWWRMSCV